MKKINEAWQRLEKRPSVQRKSTVVTNERILKAIEKHGIVHSQLPPPFLNAVWRAVQHASLLQASGGLPDKYIRTGPPSDSARIILLEDIKRAAKNSGLGGWRDGDPKSGAVLVFEAVSGLIWPGGANARATYRRYKRSKLKVEPTPF